MLFWNHRVLLDEAEVWLLVGWLAGWLAGFLESLQIDERKLCHFRIPVKGVQAGALEEECHTSGSAKEDDNSPVKHKR